MQNTFDDKVIHKQYMHNFKSYIWLKSYIWNTFDDKVNHKQNKQYMHNYFNKTNNQILWSKVNMEGVFVERGR
jgi:hypothetical protein